MSSFQGLFQEYFDILQIERVPQTLRYAKFVYLFTFFGKTYLVPKRDISKPIEPNSLVHRICCKDCLKNFQAASVHELILYEWLKEKICFGLIMTIFTPIYFIVFH